jgi:ribosomal protein S18 acetylase RimI-like enzyme
MTIEAQAGVITYAREDYAEIIDELRPLLPIHWAEISQRKDIPLDPDFDFYERANRAGVLWAYSARVGPARELAGYCIMTYSARHAHYDHAWAKDDTLWIHPDHRNLGFGNGLFDFFEADLRAMGPVVIQIETRHGHPALEFLLKSRGYGPTGMLYGKRFA